MDIEDLLGGRDLNEVKKADRFVMENSDDFEKILRLVRGVPDRTAAEAAESWIAVPCKRLPTTRIHE